MASASRIRWAAPLVRDGLRKLLGRDPTANELLFALAQGSYESGLGTFLAGECKHLPGGAKNWGAIHATSGWKGRTCLADDSTAKKKRYKQRFRVYESHPEGIADWLRNTYGASYRNRGARMLDAARKGDSYNWARAVVDTSYSTGWGDTLEERIRSIQRALDNNLPPAERALKLQVDRSGVQSSETWATVAIVAALAGAGMLVSALK